MSTRDRLHWAEYAMEAAGLGLFMVAAGLLTIAFESTGSPLREALPNGDLRRALIGVGIGLTAVVLIHSPWGQQSGAHLNPAVTLTFLRLGKISPLDALFYVIYQFVGGTLGVLLVLRLFGPTFAQPPVSYVATVPGPGGAGVAFAAEVLIAFGLMSLVLWSSNSARFSRYTPYMVGVLLAIYIFLEAPFSGMSLNPARTAASALPGMIWTAWWVYFSAPLIGMLLAAELHRRLHTIHCAKLNHHTQRRCIFNCGYHVETATGDTST